MVTLEDLEGSVQILCMNENYDKFRPLLEANKAILVTGEVNTGEDTPENFSAGNHAARRRAQKIYEAGAFAIAHRTFETGAIEMP